MPKFQGPMSTITCQLRSICGHCDFTNNLFDFMLRAKIFFSFIMFFNQSQSNVGRAYKAVKIHFKTCRFYTVTENILGLLMLVLCVFF